MGGLVIIGATLISTLLWGNLSNIYVWLGIAGLCLFGSIGFIDDFIKFRARRSLGLNTRQKLILQIAVSGLIALALVLIGFKGKFDLHLTFPFVKEWTFYLGWLYLPWILFILVGSSNAVNLADGLDGLAIMPSTLVAAGLGVLAYLAGHVYFSRYLAIPYMPGSGELAIVCAAICGAGLGFLWFNAYPAMVFMGDVGALALGAALGLIAVIIRQEFAFLIMAGLFVAETLSVIVQVTSYKLWKRRVFKMAPLHHH